MKRATGLVLTMTLLLAALPAHSEWTMEVHRGDATDLFEVSSIDSITLSYLEDFPMVFVAAGVFIMGDGDAMHGSDERVVTLTRSFYLGQHEVTNAEYMSALQWAFDNGYVSATVSSVQDLLDGSAEELLDLDDEDCEIGFSGDDTFFLKEATSDYATGTYPEGYNPAMHPVKEVSWFGCARFCDWLSMQRGLARAYAHSGEWVCNGGDPYGAQGYRLPTDAEWEYAAQFDDEREWPWGNDSPNSSMANTDSFVGWTTVAGSYPDAPDTLGLSDMGGNIWEQCNDWFEFDLGTIPETDPAGPVIFPTWRDRVTRGGSARSYWEALRCARRGWYGDDDTESWLGFRVARTAGP